LNLIFLEYLSIASKMANTCENLQKLLDKCKIMPKDGQIQCGPSTENNFKKFNEFVDITEKKFTDKFQINLIKQEIEEKLEKFEALKNEIENYKNGKF